MLLGFLLGAGEIFKKIILSNLELFKKIIPQYLLLNCSFILVEMVVIPSKLGKGLAYLIVL